MLTFNNSISIHICARTDELRESWATRFGRLFENFTRVDAIGGWVGERWVETEPVIIITCWVPAGWTGVAPFIAEAGRFQRQADQEAVAVQWVHNGAWNAAICFGADDWAELAVALQTTLGGV